MPSSSDARPDPWSSEPQIICIDPADVHVSLLADPVTNEVVAVDLVDSRGELLVQCGALADMTDDTLLLAG